MSRLSLPIRRRLRGRQTVLVITDRLLYPARAGNRRRIISLIQGLRLLGFRVVLVARRPPGWRSRVRTRLLAARVRFVDAPGFQGGAPQRYDSSPYWTAVAQAINRTRPVAAIAEYLWMAPCLDQIGLGVAKFVDTHDLMNVRRERYAELGSGAWVECSAAEEAALLRKADAVISIHSSDTAAFTALVPDRSVVTIPHWQPVRVTRLRQAPDAGGHVVMFVGSSNQGNIAGLQSFLFDGWPIVYGGDPAAEFRIYGDSGLRVAPLPQGVRAMGYVRRLSRAYRQADVVINPVSVGTGLKIKTVEALAFGKAVITTRCGAEGLESGAGTAFEVVEDMRQMAGEVARLLTDPNRRRTLEHQAQAWAQAELSPARIFREFLDFLGQKESEAGSR